MSKGAKTAQRGKAPAAPIIKECIVVHADGVYTAWDRTRGNRVTEAKDARRLQTLIARKGYVLWEGV